MDFTRNGWAIFKMVWTMSTKVRDWSVSFNSFTRGGQKDGASESWGVWGADKIRTFQVDIDWEEMGQPLEIWIIYKDHSIQSVQTGFSSFDNLRLLLLPVQ